MDEVSEVAVGPSAEPFAETCTTLCLDFLHGLKRISVDSCSPLKLVCGPRTQPGRALTISVLGQSSTFSLVAERCETLSLTLVAVTLPLNVTCTGRVGSLALSGQFDHVVADELEHTPLSWCRRFQMKPASRWPRFWTLMAAILDLDGSDEAAPPLISTRVPVSQRT
jgi:hypothetical protein